MELFSNGLIKRHQRSYNFKKDNNTLPRRTVKTLSFIDSSGKSVVMFLNII